MSQAPHMVLFKPSLQACIGCLCLLFLCAMIFVIIGIEKIMYSTVKNVNVMFIVLFCMDFDMCKEIGPQQIPYNVICKSQRPEYCVAKLWHSSCSSFFCKWLLSSSPFFFTLGFPNHWN